MKVSAQYPQEHFADILSAADNGEEVAIDRPNKPTLFLAPRTGLHWPSGHAGSC